MILAAALPKQVEISKIIARATMYFTSFLQCGLLSSKCPMKMLPSKKKMVTMAISNHTVFVLHIVINVCYYKF